MLWGEHLRMVHIRITLASTHPLWYHQTFSHPGFAALQRRLALHTFGSIANQANWLTRQLKHPEHPAAHPDPCMCCQAGSFKGWPHWA